MCSTGSMFHFKPRVLLTFCTMQSLIVLFLLFYCGVVKSEQSVSSSQSPHTSQTGFAFEMIMAKLNSLEHHLIERQLQNEEKITVLSARVDHLVKTVENLSWLVQNTGETVNQLGLNGKHMQHNATVMQRDLTQLLAGQQRLVTTHQLGEYLRQNGCNTSNASLISDEHYATYRSCNKLPFAQSGVYRIRPEHPFKAPITVLCDQEFESGGWIVIQHRFDGSTNFYREWKEYRDGFGNLDGEFWLGLDRIHQLTVSAPHELVILLEDFDGNSTIARYDQFLVGSAEQKYVLAKIDGYTGTAGDSLGDLKGKLFTTQDVDNDAASENCAVTYAGAWWYNACHQSNLNGKYLRGETKEFATSMVWKSFRGYHYSLKTSKMMIRPKI